MVALLTLFDPALGYQSLWAFLLLLLVPIAAGGIFWLQRRRTGTFVFGNTHGLRSVSGGFFGQLHWVPGLLRLLALVALVFAIARPQKPNRKVVQSEGVDVIVALDMSASMNAVDLTGQEIRGIQMEGSNPPNRFDVATSMLTEFVKSRAVTGDRVGLVLFGQDAYLKYPLTTDYVRAIKEIKGLVLDDGERAAGEEGTCTNECTIPGNGTAIGDSLRRAFLRLRDSDGKDKSIILITDGDEKGSKMAAKYVAEYMRDWAKEVDPKTGQPRKPIRIYAFQIGGGDNVFAPASMLGQRSARFGKGLIRYEEMPRGGFATNPKLLQEIAALTGGTASIGYNEDEFREQFKDFERTTYERTIEDFPDEKFMPWAYIALGLLFAEALLRLTVLRKFP